LPGTPFLKSDQQRENYEMFRCKQQTVRFNWKQRKIIEQTISDVCDHNKWILHAVNARIEHIHVVLTANKQPESVMNSLKSWCTRSLRENQLLPIDVKPWSRHGSTRYLWDEKALHDACRYVIEFQDDKPGMVHEEALPNGQASE
jgi:REP element-mobilizing transposase RayT